MQPAVTIAKREFAAYFKSPIAYIVLSFYVVLSGILFFDSFFLSGDASMELFFGRMPWISGNCCRMGSTLSARSKLSRRR